MRQVVANRRSRSRRISLGWPLAVTAGLFAGISGSPAPAASAETTAVDGPTLPSDGPRAFIKDRSSHAQCLLLDPIYQKNAQRLLRSAQPKRGAIVVLRVSDGRVLAAADYPPHTPRKESVLWSALTPSASLFKLVTTAALVEHAKLRPEHRVCSEGGEHRIGLEQLEAPKQGKIRCQPFASILATSRNAAYARLVHRHLTSEDLSNYADRFGFNAPLSAEIPIEFGRYEPAHSPLGVARTATGFVGSQLSTFGAAYLGYLIANGGERKPLRLFCDSLDAKNLAPVERALLPETARRLRDMMETVVRHGTAYDAFYDEAGHPRLPHLSVAGKTGTLGDDDGMNSWFLGFAPSRNPQYVVAVLLDNGSPWYTTAKRVAVDVLRDLFDLGPPADKK